jgi:hypothetical protein
MLKQILEMIKFPLWYDKEGQYIFDANNQMVLEVRGYGHFKDEQLQDFWGEMVVKALNDTYQNGWLKNLMPIDKNTFKREMMGDFSIDMKHCSRPLIIEELIRNIKIFWRD